MRIVLLYKGKAHRRKCANYTALIGILATSGKINIKVLISRVMKSTEEQVAEEQGGFWTGMGCIDYVFV